MGKAERHEVTEEILQKLVNDQHEKIRADLIEGVPLGREVADYQCNIHLQDGKPGGTQLSHAELSALLDSIKKGETTTEIEENSGKRLTQLTHPLVTLGNKAGLLFFFPSMQCSCCSTFEEQLHVRELPTGRWRGRM